GPVIACGNAEVLGDAADEEVGLQAVCIQHMCQHAGSGGLAMCAGNSQDMLALQYGLTEPLRAGYIGQAGVQNRFHQRVATRHNIADYEKVRLKSDLVGLEPFYEFDALFFQLGTHGRVNAGVTARDLVAGGACYQGQATHERTADAYDVQVHDFPPAPIVVGGWPRASCTLRETGCYHHS